MPTRSLVLRTNCSCTYRRDDSRVTLAGTVVAVYFSIQRNLLHSIYTCFFASVLAHIFLPLPCLRRFDFVYFAFTFLYVQSLFFRRPLPISSSLINCNTTIYIRFLIYLRVQRLGEPCSRAFDKHFFFSSLSLSLPISPLLMHCPLPLSSSLIDCNTTSYICVLVYLRDRRLINTSSPLSLSLPISPLLMCVLSLPLSSTLPARRVIYGGSPRLHNSQARARVHRLMHREAKR